MEGKVNSEGHMEGTLYTPGNDLRSSKPGELMSQEMGRWRRGCER